jgi:hypothetical protein
MKFKVTNSSYALGPVFRQEPGALVIEEGFLRRLVLTVIPLAFAANLLAGHPMNTHGHAWLPWVIYPIFLLIAGAGVDAWVRPLRWRFDLHHGTITLFCGRSKKFHFGREEIHCLKAWEGIQAHSESGIEHAFSIQTRQGKNVAFSRSGYWEPIEVQANLLRKTGLWTVEVERRS